MFGIRPDGLRVKQADPIILFTPYIMPARNDAQNICKITLDYDVLARYIKQKRMEGQAISFMTIVLAGYIRTLSQHPELNRFVANKQLFARNVISISFVVLKETEPGKPPEESLAKVEFNPEDTIFDVNEKITKTIENGRKLAEGTLTDKFAGVVLKVPGFPNFVVGLARLLDRYGLLPKLVHDASPFHTSMFITNMASINMPYLYHHLYNFGTTSVFLAIGKVERSLLPLPGGKMGYKRQLPLGVVTDERIMGGAEFAIVFRTMSKYMNNPELLETPPEQVKTDIPLKRARPVT